MKLFELRKQLPKSAGEAKLEFTGGSHVGREGKTIRIPYDPENEIYSLQKGIQFLLRVPANTKEFAHYFGGTDESPFLVSLDEEPFGVFQDEGEEGFYRSLKPEKLQSLEEALGIEAKRQGDIFALPLPFSWKEIIGIGSVYQVLIGHSPSQLRAIKKESIFGTRHVLTGRYTEEYAKDYTERVFLGEGTLEAPDHSPLIVEGPHLFMQAAYLKNPQMAD